MNIGLQGADVGENFVKIVEAFVGSIDVFVVSQFVGEMGLANRSRRGHAGEMVTADAGPMAFVKDCSCAGPFLFLP